MFMFRHVREIRNSLAKTEENIGEKARLFW